MDELECLLLGEFGFREEDFFVVNGLKFGCIVGYDFYYCDWFVIVKFNFEVLWCFGYGFDFCDLGLDVEGFVDFFYKVVIEK